MLRLAWRGVLRNWDRTALGVAGMALAAAVLTGALALPHGFPAGLQRGARALVGGDVVVLAGRPLLGPADLQGPAGVWVWHPFPPALPSDLAVFFPDLATSGAIAPADAPAALGPSDLQRLAELPGVAAVYPDEALPALDAAGRLVLLRGRDPALDARLGVGDFLRFGRPLTPADEAAAAGVCLIDASDPSPQPPPTAVTLGLPRLRGYGPDGEPVWDFGNPAPLTLAVVGGYALPTDAPAQVLTADGQPVLQSGPDQSGLVTVDGYWPAHEVWVPEATWRAAWAAVAGGAAYRPVQAALVATSTLQASRLAAAAAQLLAGDTVLTVPALVAAAGDRVDLRAGHYQVSQAGAPAQPLALNGVAAALAVLVAGLLMAGNMLVLVAARRREIGVLKALGAGPAAVAAMVVLEAAGFALVGAVIGFVAVQAVVSLMELASQAAPAAVLLGGLRQAGVVLGAAVLAAVVCAGLPAVEAARVPAAAVLREEA